MPCLIGLQGLIRGQRFPLKTQVLIGRCPEADIHLLDTMVTRRHCVLSIGPQGCVIEDLGSRNGTFVNGNPITRPTPLKDGDVIRIHAHEFRFADAGDPTASSVVLTDSKAEKTSSIVDAVEVRKGGTGDLTDAARGAEAFASVLKRLETVVEVSCAVCGLLDLDPLLDEVMNCFLKLFPRMERGFVLLRDPQSDTLEVKLARHRDPNASRTISVSRHIIDAAIERRAGILSADAMDDTRFTGAGSVLDFRIRSMMCAPLIAKEEVLGAIHLDTSSGEPFAREDLEMFTLVANQTAVALSNVRMHEQLRKREAVEQDLAMARHVQHSFLPAELPDLPGLAFAVTYRAALEVGGDLYDFIPLRDGRLGIVIGDVMGKGMHAALMMVRVMSDVRYLAMSDPEPASVLTRLNLSLSRRGTQGSFVTGLFMVLDPATRELVFSNAAHYPPVLRGKDDKVSREIGAGEAGLPLGAIEESEFPQESLILQPGDCVLTYTDGVTEAENASEALYGAERLNAALSASEARPAALLNGLLDDVKSFVGDTPPSDDLTVLAFGVKVD